MSWRDFLPKRKPSRVTKLSLFALVPTLALAANTHAYTASPQTAVLDVKNMTCSVCPITVRKSLQKLAGVTEAKIDFDKKTAMVKFDADRVTLLALAKATTDAGFPSTLRK